MVEFADYECPYCRQSYASVRRVLANYGDRVRYVYRDFPLAFHPRATPAALASRCAEEQGKYWEYHENLMTVSGDLSDRDLVQRAESLGLDLARFRSCLDSKCHQGAIDASLLEGRTAGVEGTPAFYINGRFVSGAKSFDTFRAIIDEELSRPPEGNQ